MSTAQPADRQSPMPMYIGGEWVPSESGLAFDNLNPEDDSVWRSVARASAHDVDRAVRASHRAFDAWRESSPRVREHVLLEAVRIIQRDRADIADQLVSENGSPIMKARFEMLAAVEYLTTAAAIPRNLHGHTYQSDNAGRIVTSMREPLGVVASIVPFNVPFLKTAREVAGVIATGNTCVGLPSELAPVAMLRFARIFEEAGLPPGVFNVVTGFGAEIGDSLTGHPLVRHVMFTGSSVVGRHISAICGRGLKRATLELGGKSPLVILADADVDKAVMTASFGIFLFGGQGCMCNSRIIAERPVYEETVAKLAARAEFVRANGFGDLRDDRTWRAPLISSRQRERVKLHIDDALAKGARLVTGGGWVGHACEPTVLADVTPDMLVCRQETFGPVVAVYAADDFDAAVAMANDTEFGLSSAIWTRDVNKALSFTRKAQAGMVHVNAGTFYDEPHVPFGGMRESGKGREGHLADIEELTELKVVSFQLDSANALGAPVVMKPQP